MENNIIIVAGGKGLRVGHDLPKQFIPIAGKPILMHTIEAFYKFDNAMKIVLVLHPSYVEYWKELCFEYSFTIPLMITTGGETRFHSVKNGLELVESGLVGVHDGARPFVSNELIAACFENAKTYNAVIPAIDSTDSLREVIDSKQSKIVDRSKIKLVQTPQVFKVEILKKAYDSDYSDLFTDDASVVESIGVNIHLVSGETANIKITTPFDLDVAKIILKEYRA